MNMFILGIIPARGGSKGIPKKNITLLCTRPLIAYTIDASRESQLLSDTILSTDSSEIRDTALILGAKAPMLRPSELSQDNSTSLDVVIHAVNTYEEMYNKTVDIVALLQPTTPLRTALDIDESIRLLMNNPSASSLISCYQSVRVHPRIMYTIKNGIAASIYKDNSLGIRRQDFEDIYVRNGAIYLTKRELLNQGKLIEDNPLCYIMKEECSINIDTHHDLRLAEYYLQGFCP